MAGRGRWWERSKTTCWRSDPSVFGQTALSRRGQSYALTRPFREQAFPARWAFQLPIAGGEQNREPW